MRCPAATGSFHSMSEVCVLVTAAMSPRTFMWQSTDRDGLVGHRQQCSTDDQRIALCHDVMRTYSYYLTSRR
jgi:hypothetical protein